MRASLSLALAVTLLAFAANSLLTRAALDGDLIGPEAFVLIRLGSGAVFLALLVRRPVGRLLPQGRLGWGGAVSLFVYAIAFTLAYVHLAAGLGALLLFGVVQLTLLGLGLLRGERFGVIKALASLMALGGLVLLLGGGELRGSFSAGLLMMLAGLAWAAQTAIGQVPEAKAQTPLLFMTRNFFGACVLALPLLLAWPLWAEAGTTGAGLGLALASGALASGLGYALWYWVLPSISTLLAGVSQLLVPLIAAVAGLIWLQEPLGWRLLISGALILGGVLMVLRTDQTGKNKRS